MNPGEKTPRPAGTDTGRESERSDVIVTDVTIDVEAKRSATLRARAALLGATLHRLEDGRFLVSRLGLSREHATLDDVERFIAAMEGGR